MRPIVGDPTGADDRSAREVVMRRLAPRMRRRELVEAQGNPGGRTKSPQPIRPEEASHGNRRCGASTQRIQVGEPL